MGTKTETAFFEGAGFVDVYGVIATLASGVHTLIATSQSSRDSARPEELLNIEDFLRAKI